MSEVSKAVEEKKEETTKFKIKVTEKAPFPATLSIASMKLSDLAASLNGLFTPYKDFMGSDFKVDYINNIPVINYSLCFLLGAQGEGITSAFTTIDDEIKGDTQVDRMIRREKLLSNGKRSRLTKDGEEGIEEFILPYYRKKWKTSQINEIVEKDRYGNASKIFIKISGIDYIACAKKIFGSKIETSDGLHDAVYNILPKKALSGTPTNMAWQQNNQQPYVQDWLIELIQGDVNSMNDFFREIGVFVNPNSPELQIVPR